MRIGELAAVSGASRATLRFYEKQGLLQAQRQNNGYRRYAADAVRQVGDIRAAQQLGFSLAEIRQQWPLHGQGPHTEQALAAALCAKLADIDARIGALCALRTQLRQRLPCAERCSPNPPGVVAQPCRSACAGGDCA